MSGYDRKHLFSVLLVFFLVLLPAAAFSAVRVMPLGDSITYDTYSGDPRLPGQKNRLQAAAVDASVKCRVRCRFRRRSNRRTKCVAGL